MAPVPAQAPPSQPEPHHLPPAAESRPMPTSAPAPAARERQLWQLPAFLLGAAALAAVGVGRQYWKPADATRAARDLAAARDALEQAPPDLATARDRARRALDRSGSKPHLAAEAHFLYGSARLLEADAADSDPEAIRAEARDHLEKADALGAPAADPPRLRYRLAKAWLFTNGDPAKALDALQRTTDDAADDRAERYGLLAEARLRLSEPDLRGALEASKEQLRLLPTTEPRRMALARFRTAELHLRLGEPDQAEPLLKRVGAEPAPELFFASRGLLARCHQARQEYTEAARC